MRAIDSDLLRKFLRLAGKRLAGDWYLIGGTVLPCLFGGEHRITLDIDLFGAKPSQMAQTLRLMELAGELGLPVEAINQAGAFFLSRIKHTREDWVLLHRGPKAAIYRPSATLFLLLKLRRMTESDLADCLEMLRYAEKKAEPVDRERVVSAVRALDDEDESGGRRARRERLLARLASLA